MAMEASLVPIFRRSGALDDNKPQCAEMTLHLLQVLDLLNSGLMRLSLADVEVPIPSSARVAPRY